MHSNKKPYTTPPLFEDIIFLRALFCPIIIALIISFIILLSPESVTIFLNNLIKNLKLPIAIAALSIPLTAFVIANQRSKLMLKQIEKSTEQQAFSNYTHHMNEFKEFCLNQDEPINRLMMRKNIKFDVIPTFFDTPMSPWKLYKAIYPFAKSGNFNINAEIILDIEKHTDKKNIFFDLRDKYSKLFGVKYSFLNEAEEKKLIFEQKVILDKLMKTNKENASASLIQTGTMPVKLDDQMRELQVKIQTQNIILGKLKHYKALQEDNINHNIREILIEILMRFDAEDNSKYLEILR